MTCATNPKSDASHSVNWSKDDAITGRAPAPIRQGWNAYLPVSPPLAAVLRHFRLVADKNVREENGGFLPEEERAVIQAFLDGLAAQEPALVFRGRIESMALGHMVAHMLTMDDAESVELFYEDAQSDGEVLLAHDWTDLPAQTRDALVAEAWMLCQNLDVVWRSHVAATRGH